MTRAIKGFFDEITDIPPILKTPYFASLNGLRGIAIILVILSHLTLSSSSWYDVIFNGKLGVLIFFVLSGFLITTLCIKEKIITGNISLRNFYIRRSLRIFPVAYLFLLVIIILNYFFKLNISGINLFGAAFYLMNISSIFRRYYFSWYTGHFWSLAVEEQFYLFVPFILKKKFKVYLGLLLAIIFLLPLFICLQSVFRPLNNTVLYALTHYLVKFQAIAVGCLFSVLTFKYSFTDYAVKRSKVIANIIAIFLIFYIQYDDFFTIKSMFSGLVISFLIGYIIVSNISFQTDIIYKFLNIKPLKVAGVLSYSIYIWQQIFTSKDPKLPAFMATFPYNLICIIVVSCLSYYFYERFFLKLKSKFNKSNKEVTVAAA